jgi:hypothetical protein
VRPLPPEALRVVLGGREARDGAHDRPARPAAGAGERPLDDPLVGALGRLGEGERGTAVGAREMDEMLGTNGGAPPTKAGKI